MLSWFVRTPHAHLHTLYVYKRVPIIMHLVSPKFYRWTFVLLQILCVSLVLLKYERELYVKCTWNVREMYVISSLFHNFCYSSLNKFVCDHLTRALHFT